MLNLYVAFAKERHSPKLRVHPNRKRKRAHYTAQMTLSGAEIEQGKLLYISLARQACVPVFTESIARAAAGRRERVRSLIPTPSLT